MAEVGGLRAGKGGRRGEEEIHKGDVFVGRLRKQAGGPGRDPVYRGVTAGSSVAGESEDRDEALGMLVEAWEEEREAQRRS